jgi:hypothetical protein
MKSSLGLENQWADEISGMSVDWLFGDHESFFEWERDRERRPQRRREREV